MKPGRATRAIYPLQNPQGFRAYYTRFYEKLRVTITLSLPRSGTDSLYFGPFLAILAIGGAK